MHAIISELDEAAAVQVMRLWRRLNQACGLEGIFNFPNPHFTWFLAEEIQVARCVPILEAMVSCHLPLDVHTLGVGLFSGDNPVLYLPIVKSAELIELQQSIWEQLTPLSLGIGKYYVPDSWVPHITLALMDLTTENLTCAIDSIAYEPIELLTQADNILIVEQAGREIGETLHRFQFSEHRDIK